MEQKKIMTVKDLRDLIDSYVESGKTNWDSPVLWQSDEFCYYGEYTHPSVWDSLNMTKVKPFNDTFQIEYLERRVCEYKRKLEQKPNDEHAKSHLKESMEELCSYKKYLEQKALVLGTI